MKELYVLRTRNLRKPVYWFFRSQTQINQKWAKVLLRDPENRDPRHPGYRQSFDWPLRAPLTRA